MRRTEIGEEQTVVENGRSDEALRLFTNEQWVLQRYLD